jgi:long-subunit acyl-CoA synthetase (AMP-forming)
MGQVQSVGHRGTLVALDEEVGPGESSVYRSSVCYLENGGDLITAFRSQPDSHTAIDILCTSAGTYPGLDCVGERELLPDGSHGRYKWMSYSDFYQQVLVLGRGLLELGFQRAVRLLANRTFRGRFCRHGPRPRLRFKQLIKFSQGEYFSLTSLNDHYSSSELAEFVYVYANSKYDQPVAVVVPKKEKIEQWQSAGIQDVMNDRTVTKEVMESLKKVHQDRGLRGFERIAGVIIDLEIPTPENGLLTPSMKPQLVGCKKRYEARLLELYETITQAPPSA